MNRNDNPSGMFYQGDCRLLPHEELCAAAT